MIPHFAYKSIIRGMLAQPKGGQNPRTPPTTSEIGGSPADGHATNKTTGDPV
jgi:hypothetical protein